MPHGTRGKGPHPWREGKKGPWKPDTKAEFVRKGLLPSFDGPTLGDAFKDPDLVGSANELTDFDGSVTSSGGGGGAGANPLAGNKLAALRNLETKPTRRIGRKRADKGPSRSRVY